MQVELETTFFMDLYLGWTHNNARLFVLFVKILQARTGRPAFYCRERETGFKTIKYGAAVLMKDEKNFLLQFPDSNV